MEKMKKIILSIHDLATGGSEKVIVTEANMLFDMGYDVRLVTMLKEQRNELAFLLRIPKEHFIQFHFDSHFDIGELFKLVKFLRNFKPDIVISASLFNNTIFKFAKIFYPNLKLIVREGNIFTRHRFKSRLFDALTSFMISKYFVDARAIKEDMIKRLKIPSGKISVIYNGIDKNSFNIPAISRENKRKELRISPDTFVLLNVGSMSTAQKGQEYLIRAMAKIKNENIQLIFAGDGKRKDKLIKEAEELGVSERVVFLGKRKDVAELKVASDVFVFPSLWEGMPNAMFDAMASGMAMIVTPVGGIPEVVKDGQSALFIKPADADGLAEAILKLKKDDGLRKILGENAHKSSLRPDLTWEHHIKKVLELF